MKAGMGLLLLLCLSLGSARVYGQPPEVDWVRNYGGAGSQRGCDVEVAPSGGFVVAAQAEADSTQFPQANIWVFATDGAGEPLWERHFDYGEQSSQWPAALSAVTDQGFYVYGAVRVTPASVYGAGLLRLTEAGDTVWTRFYQREGEILTAGPLANAALQTWDGGALIARAHSDFGQGAGAHTFLIRADFNGDTLWTRDIGYGWQFRLLALSEEIDGTFKALGQRAVPGVSDSTELCLVEISAQGDSLGGLCRRVRTGAGAFFTAQPTGDGGFYLGGMAYPSGGSTIYAAARVDNNLELLWSNTYPGAPDAWSSASASLVMPDGGLLLAGNGPVNFLRLSAAGDSLWTIELPEPVFLIALSLAPDGSVVGVGWGLRSGVDDVVLVHLSPEGQAAVGHEPAAPTAFGLAAYPNPFNPATEIRFTLPQAGRVELAVYDLTGRRVATLLDESLSAGEQRVAFDAAGLASGIYFARLETAAATQTHKLVLLK